ncbi:hypothetical protein A3B02_00865 [Candidatus Roizmanbacteria bacterium RIFCSPLOWO2_01_FULL_42_14]|uniref:Uncharacterized protein n=3 Tax=Candidatus Roizmaniibacteriota TaxID=1752723 RepID=A0A1F7J7M5_9BACT|nr:MAG: hypothetical protein A3D08_02855 [Candidatus Roizmanbacteria bacterium RIFCSPHIGHO2_02_FULL_43_11]OGK38750.1 MAG: hypothetical protein A3F32_00680 [Candidatus Roizmanbacteria bacterium RIFCSPHIGHO2_12_FULL_42_10]OGK51601.1 MAG: hypothetical protein A3B02_00865 [Candidatus Roizmanbacteria bacterium RIFCSPLOWO2_01_FULL_42_14]
MARKSRQSNVKNSLPMLYILIGVLVLLTLAFILSWKATQDQAINSASEAASKLCNPQVLSLTPYNQCPRCKGTACPPGVRWKGARYRCAGDTQDRELPAASCQVGQYKYWRDRAAAMCALRCVQQKGENSGGGVGGAGGGVGGGSEKGGENSGTGGADKSGGANDVGLPQGVDVGK